MPRDCAPSGRIEENLTFAQKFISNVETGLSEEESQIYIVGRSPAGLSLTMVDSTDLSTAKQSTISLFNTTTSSVMKQITSFYLATAADANLVLVAMNEITFPAGGGKGTSDMRVLNCSAFGSAVSCDPLFFEANVVPMAVATSKDGSISIIVSSSKLTVWDTFSLYTEKLPGFPYTAALSPSGRVLAIPFSNGLVSVYTRLANSGTLSRMDIPIPYLTGPNQIVCSDRWIAFLNVEQPAAVWNLFIGQFDAEFKILRNLTLAYSPSDSNRASDFSMPKNVNLQSDRYLIVGFSANTAPYNVWVFDLELLETDSLQSPQFFFAVPGGVNQVATSLSLHQSPFIAITSSTGAVWTTGWSFPV